MSLQKKLSPRLVGLNQVLISGICFGFLGFFGKSAFAVGISAGEYVALRFLLAASALWVMLLVTGKIGSARLDKRQLLSCALLGTVGYALFSNLCFMAMEGLSASLTVLLLYTYPVMVAVGEVLFLKQPLTKRILVSLPLVILGTVLLVGTDLSTSAPSFLIFGFGSALFYALYILGSSRFLAQIPTLVATTYIMTFAAIALSLVHLHDSERALGLVTGHWTLFTQIVVVGTLIPIGLFLAGLKSIRPSEASILSTAEPLTAIIVAGAVLGESLQSVQIIGGAMVLAVMVYLGTEHVAKKADS